MSKYHYSRPNENIPKIFQNISRFYLQYSLPCLQLAPHPHFYAFSLSLVLIPFNLGWFAFLLLFFSLVLITSSFTFIHWVWIGSYHIMHGFAFTFHKKLSLVWFSLVQVRLSSDLFGFLLQNFTSSCSGHLSFKLSCINLFLPFQKFDFLNQF